MHRQSGRIGRNVCAVSRAIERKVRPCSLAKSPSFPAQSALLFIDVQNFAAHRQGAEFKDLPAAEFEAKYGWYFRELEARVIPNMQRLQRACRAAKVEVLYTTIESLTLDGRDRSLDYKITGFNVPKGSWDGRVIDEIAPAGDEIWLPKGSSSVFVSTHIDYLLRNLGVRQLIISGLITDQCVEFRHPRCLRPRLPGHPGDRRLPHLLARASRELTADHQGLLPPAHRRRDHRRTAGAVCN